MTTLLRRLAKPVIFIAVLAAGAAMALDANPPDPAAAPADGGLDLAYSGRFRDDQRFRAVLEAAPAARARALAAVSERLALAYVDRGSILLRFRDALDLSQRFLTRVPPNRFVTGPETAGGRQRVVVTGSAEFLLEGGTEVEETLTHEMTHAIMRERMGGRYEALPVWVREGLALWTARQGPAFVRYYLAHPAFVAQPETLVAGLARDRGLVDYPEDWLAFDYLESERGAEGVRKFVAGLLAGRPWQATLGEITGRDWPAFQAQAQRHALDALGRLADPGLADYRRLCELARDVETTDKAAPLLDAARAFARDYPQSVHSRAASFHEGRALLRLGKHSEARAALARALAPGCPASGFEANAAFLLARRDWDDERWADAAAAFARVVGEHPDSPLLPESLYRWGLALAKAGPPANARRVLMQALASFPGGELAQAARLALEQ